MNEFRVQDVVFVAIEKKQQILPARVVKKITQESIEGITVLLTLEFPDTNILQTVPADHNIFGSIKEARVKLIERITETIDKMCDQAVSLSEKKFGSKSTVSNNDDLEVSALATGQEDKDVILVELPDGTTARVRDNTSQA